MYQALYRKWRPQTFAEVCGQTEVVQMLRSQMQSGRISHAYLLCGTRGTGKTTVAKILAKAVNCENPQGGDACGVCDICRSVADGSNVDIIEIDAASNNGVDNVRDIRDAVVYAPAMSKYKVYIIDEVHMLSASAFNALLKTLEEPPAHVIFILATTDPNKLPATILSRCQRFDFKPLPEDVLTARLRAVCDGEGIEAQDRALSLIAHLANGGMRDALSVLDQCSAGEQSVTYERVAALCGIGERAYIGSLLEAVSERRYDEALKVTERLAVQGKSFTLACEELLSAVRDMLVIKTVDGYRAFLTAPAGEVPALEAAAQGFSVNRLLSLADTLIAEKEKLARGGGRRIDFEFVMFRACSPEIKNDCAALEERLCAVERMLAGGAGALEAPARREKPKAAKADVEPEKAQTPAKPEKANNPDRANSPEAAVKPNTAGAAQAPAKGQTPPFWAELLAKSDHSLAAPLRTCKAELDGDRLIIYAGLFAKNFLSNSLPTQSIRHMAQLITGKQYEIVFKDLVSPDDPFAQIDGFKVFD